MLDPNSLARIREQFGIPQGGLKQQSILDNRVSAFNTALSTSPTSPTGTFDALAQGAKKFVAGGVPSLFNDEPAPFSFKDALVEGVRSRKESLAKQFTFDPENPSEGFGETVMGFAGGTAPVKKIADKVVAPIFEGFTDLSTKLLKDLEGKSKVAKQYILDATNRPELKQPEKELFRKLLEDEGDSISVPDFANRVKSELLPLSNFENPAPGYENITLPDNLRGPVAGYSERIYRSPIKTSAKNVHFSDLDSSADGYFAHTRIEDLPNSAVLKSKQLGEPLGDISASGGTTRRVIEIQSDLFQKGRLEKERNPKTFGRWDDLDLRNAQERLEYLEREARKSPARAKELEDEIIDAKIDVRQRSNDVDAMAERNKGIDKLEPYRNTWHERVIREEVKQAAIDGKTKLQFPTGETAMKIEGLGEGPRWMTWDITRGGYQADLKPEDLQKVFEGGVTIKQGGQEWIITDVLGDGKFKAVPKSFVDIQPSNWKITLETESGKVMPESSTEKGLVWVARNEKNGKMEFQPFAPSKKQDALTFLKEKIGSKDKSIKELGEAYGETFDISGKVDTNNPIYKFYEKTVQKYLTNKYGGKVITDPQGVKWVEIDVKPEYKKLPIEAFGALALPTIHTSKGED